MFGAPTFTRRGFVLSAGSVTVASYAARVLGFDLPTGPPLPNAPVYQPDFSKGLKFVVPSGAAVNAGASYVLGPIQNVLVISQVNADGSFSHFETHGHQIPIDSGSGTEWQNVTPNDQTFYLTGWQIPPGSNWSILNTQALIGANGKPLYCYGLCDFLSATNEDHGGRICTASYQLMPPQYKHVDIPGNNKIDLSKAAHIALPPSTGAVFTIEMRSLPVAYGICVTAAWTGQLDSGASVMVEHSVGDVGVTTRRFYSNVSTGTACDIYVTGWESPQGSISPVYLTQCELQFTPRAADGVLFIGNQNNSAVPAGTQLAKLSFRLV